MIKHDYKPHNNQKLFKKPLQFKLPQWLTHPYLIIGTAFCVLLLALILSYPETHDEPVLTVNEVIELSHQEFNDKSETLYSEPITIQLEALSDPENVLELAKPIRIANEEVNWKSESVKKGDSLSQIFARIGLSPQQLDKVVNLSDETKILKKLRPGEIISYQINTDNQLAALKYAINIQEILYIETVQDKLISRIENKTIEYRTAYSQGIINDSLSLAGKKSGLTESQVMQLANIFEWDIDFSLDIRKGDSFSMLYLEKYLEGEKIGNGEIVAAEFIVRGKIIQAVSYTNKNDVTSYYTPEGLSMRKAFLRNPIEFSHISSSFKPKRFHPILKVNRPHNGVDYVAKTGTPIRAAGDGKVIQSSSNPYNGKYVFIQHGQGIVTKYLHMSRRAVSNNQRVKQGEVIGYVGMTGLAEAPHLHYAFEVNGVYRNPRTVALPKAEPVASSEKAKFLEETSQWMNQLSIRNAIKNNS